MRKSMKPRHIAVIMDGNGRWAKQQDLPRASGHEAGADAVRAVIEQCASYQIEVLTLFAFSSENWGRPVAEVDALMRLFLASLQDETSELHRQDIRVSVIGDLSRFSNDLQTQIAKTEKHTQFNSGLHLVIAANYSGRWDITQATRQLATQVATQALKPEAITEALVAQALCLADLPEPDLLIRTSGEQRLSNFMLWQFAYTEFYFSDVFWPDFNAAEFEKALAFYALRERRFGLTAAQLQE